jgi:predicted secreted protein
MAGELNGTTAMLMKGTGTGAVIVGQMEFTMTYGGTPIDISNKSFGDYVTYLDGELATKQVVLSGSVIYNNDSVYQEVRAETLTGTQDDYALVYGNGEKLEAKFVPTGMSDALPHGASVTTTISFNSSGAVTHTPYTA